MNRNRNAVLASAVVAVAWFGGTAVQAQYMASAGAAVNQNFNSLPTSGTSNVWANGTTLPGWFLFRSPAPGTAITAIAANNGSVTTGAFISFGTGTTTERALGGLGSGGAYFGSPATGTVAGWIAFGFKNDTSTTDFNQAVVNFDGEQWRDGGNTTAQSMVFEYGYGNTFQLVSSWTAPGGTFNWTSPIATSTAAQLDGNAAANRVANRGGTLSLSVPVGETVWFRWIENNDAGNDHGLAIDNFVATFTGTPVVAGGKDLRWNLASSGTWDTTTTNFVTNTASGSPTVFADDDSVTFSNTASATVNVAATVSPKSLTLNNGSDVTLTGAAVSTSATGTLTLAGVSLTVNQAGAGLFNKGGLVLTGNNTVTVSSGSTFDAGNNIYALPAGSSLTAAGSFLANTLNVTGGTLSVPAGGSVALTGAFTVDGTTASVAGALTSTSTTVKTAAGLTFEPTAVASVGSVSVTDTSTLTVGGAVTASALTVGTGTLTVNAGGNLTVTGTSATTTSGQFNVAGTMSVDTVSQSATGSIAIPAGGKLRITGTLGSNSVSNIYPGTAGNINGDIEITATSRVNFNNGTWSGTGRILTSSNGATGGSLTIATNGNQPANSTTNLALPIVLNTNNTPALFQLNFGATGGTTIAYTGAISGNGNVNLAVGTSGGAGVLLLGGSQSYTGATFVNSSGNGGTIRLTSDTALPSTTDLTFNTHTSSYAGPGPIDLSGVSPTIGSLSTGAGLGSANKGRLLNTGTASTLTLTGAGTATYAGLISGPTSIVKTGTGLQRFTGSLAFTGSVTNSAGTLVIEVPTTSSQTVLDVSGVSVTGGVVQLAATDRAGGALPRLIVTDSLSVAGGLLDLTNNDTVVQNAGQFASITSAVQTWWNGGERNGFGVGSTAATLDSATTLGVILNDDGTGNTVRGTIDGYASLTTDVIVKYTYLGDTDLNGKVDTDDLGRLIKGIRNGLTGWYNGDTNYDGVVNGVDYANLLLALNTQTAAGLADTSGGSGGTGTGAGVIPEPSALGLMALALPMLSRRRRI